VKMALPFGGMWLFLNPAVIVALVTAVAVLPRFATRITSLPESLPSRTPIKARGAFSSHRRCLRGTSLCRVEPMAHLLDQTHRSGAVVRNDERLHLIRWLPASGPVPQPNCFSEESAPSRPPIVPRSGTRGALVQQRQHRVETAPPAFSK